MLMEEARGLDTKATLVAGFAAAGVSYLLATRRHTIWWLALAGYLAALALALAALWPRRWDGLDPAAVRDELSEAAPVFVVGLVAGSKVTIYERNFNKARAKAVFWTASVVAFAVGSEAVGVGHHHGETAMSDTSRKPPAPTSKAVAPATTAPRASAAPAAKTDKAKPRPAMRSDERLIGRSIIGSGSPHKN